MRIPRPVVVLWRRYRAAKIPMLAAALAYHTVLAIVPLIGLVFWYLSNIHVVDKWLVKTKLFMISQLNVASSALFTEYFEKLTSTVKGRSWGWVGLLILTYTVWSLIERFGQSLDSILESAQLSERPSRRFSVLLARRVVIMAGMPVALALSIAASEWVRRDSWANFIFKLPAIGSYLAIPLAWTTSIVTLTLVYHFVPKYYVPWTQALRVAIFVAPLSEIVRYCVGIYSRYSVANHKIYGVLAVVPVFILWVQIGWVIILSGALFLHPRDTQ